MNIEEIRKSAPSGATHYDDFKNYYSCGVFLKVWDFDIFEWVVMLHEPYFELKPL